MERPRTRHTKTSDGVSIAYSVFGSGPPLVYSLTLSHQILFYESPVWREWFDGLADRYQVIVFDSRGNGLSQRNVAWTPEGFERELEAVVKSMSLDEYFVFSTYSYTHGAIRHAIAHPDSVAGLIFWAGYINGERALEPTFLFDLARDNGDLFLRPIPQTMHWLEQGEVLTYIDILRQATTQDDWLAAIAAARASDVEAILPRLKTPALVLHPRELDIVRVEEAMKFASALPNGQLVLLEGPRAIPTGEVVEPALAAIAAFTDRISGIHDRGQPLTAGTVRIVLFTDIVGHTEMMRRLGDTTGRGVLREHERITRLTLRAYDGSEVKSLGDGLMASFSSVTKAMDCAIALQRAFAAHEGEPLQVRVGLNAGEPIEEDGDLFGSTVIMASRIAAHPGPREILVPGPLRHLPSRKSYV